MNRQILGIAIATAFLCGGIRQATADQPTSRLRRPVALVLAENEAWLYVANRESGTLSVIDVAKRELAGEIDLGGRLSDLCRWTDGKLLAVDEAGHKLIVLSADGPRVEVLRRIDVEKYPVGVTVSPDGQTCYVTSLWSRRLSVIELAGDAATADKTDKTRHVVDLPFAPRRLLPVRGELIVADAFGGKLGVVDPRAGKLLLVREFPAHNIRGLGVSSNGRMLLVAHQMLNELAHTVRNDVHWGLLMSNDLRWLLLDNVLDSSTNLYERGHMHPLGEAGNASADPGGLAVADNGLVVVALSGVGEVAIGVESDFSLQRVQVGKRPTAVVVDHAAKNAYVANTFDDSISIVDLGERETTATISLGPQPELTEVQHGELLFYDGRLSHDSWMSCHSCHTDGHTNGQLSDNFSDLSFGAPKRVLSLLGRAGTEPFAWNGGSHDYAAQIKKSIANTMQGSDDPPQRDVAALAAFLAQLEPPPSIDAARDTHDAAAVARGADVFKAQNCAKCHTPPKYTSPGLYDVGLKDKQGNTRFNPPPLLGVGQRGPYFHDASAASLRDVFEIHGHQLQKALSKEQLDDLLAFLRSL